MSNDRTKGIPYTRKIILSLTPLLIVLLLLELGGRIVYYQRRSGYPFALIHIYHFVLNKKKEYELKKGIDQYLLQAPQDPFQHYVDFFESPELEETRKKFFHRYEMIFGHFVQLCKDTDVRQVILYIPSSYSPSSRTGREISRKFFSDLARKYKLPYLDVTEKFSAFPNHITHLWPHNGHLSRFGNKLIADTLGIFLAPLLSYRSKISYNDRPVLLGDMKPSEFLLREIVPSMPYRVITNSQGLRRTSDIVFPKPGNKCRILFIGDSFTQGAYLPNHDSFPQLLEEAVTSIEAVNSGIEGYTICDEYSYYKEKGKYIEPDIVVLQVLDNDLYGFYPFKQKMFCRGGEFCIHPN